MPKLEISLLMARISADLTTFHLVFPTGLDPAEGKDVACPPLGPQPLAQGFHEFCPQAVTAKE